MDPHARAYDAVFDFDVAVRDPSHPERLQVRFDPGDHLHLNAAGYEALANTIDLNLFRGVVQWKFTGLPMLTVLDSTEASGCYNPRP